MCTWPGSSNRALCPCSQITKDCDIIHHINHLSSAPKFVSVSSLHLDLQWHGENGRFSHWVVSVCSPPGSSIHAILQARILEWVVIPFAKGYSQLKEQTHNDINLALLFLGLRSYLSAHYCFSGTIPSLGFSLLGPYLLCGNSKSLLRILQVPWAPLLRHRRQLPDRPQAGWPPLYFSSKQACTWPPPVCWQWLCTSEGP